MLSVIIIALLFTAHLGDTTQWLFSSENNVVVSLDPNSEFARKNVIFPKFSNSHFFFGTQFLVFRGFAEESPVSMGSGFTSEVGSVLGSEVGSVLGSVSICSVRGCVFTDLQSPIGQLFVYR